LTEAATTTSVATTPKPAEGSLKPALDMSPEDYAAARRKLTGRASRDPR
jgi:hypothetical protein